MPTIAEAGVPGVIAEGWYALYAPSGTPPRIIDTLLESMRDQKLTGIAEVTQAFRRQYYEIVKRTLKEQRQVIPCMAGIASAQDPLRMAWAMRYACESGRLAYLAGRIPRKLYAQASSPLEGRIATAKS